MAPPNKLTLIALLLAFAVFAPSAAAIRDGGAAKDAPAPAPSANGEDAAVQPMSVFDDIVDDIVGDIIHFRIPDLPLPRILPCPPAFPKIPFVPCYNETEPVPECRSLLAKYIVPACAGFLTDAADNGSASTPPKECCNAIGPFFNNHTASAAPLCLCHAVNGDLSKLLKAPMNNTRVGSFLQQCGLGLTPDQVHTICTDKTLHIPPMDAPSPPPTWRHH